MISFSVEFSPAASERFAFEIGAMGMSGSTSEETVALTRAVERSIRDSRALDTESLCILAGKLVRLGSKNLPCFDASHNGLSSE